MAELYKIISSHHPKHDTEDLNNKNQSNEKEIQPKTFEIPEVFFDDILIHFKLSRIEILILSFLYRQVYSRSNLARIHGISPLLSHQKIIEKLNIEPEQLYLSLRSLEKLNLIETIKSGQYFVRKYFTRELDEYFKQTYDDF